LDDGDASGFTGTLVMIRSGRAGHKEEAVVAVREQPPHRERKKNNLQEDVESTAPGKEGNAIHR
jgi:hypothetical protein